MSALPEGWVEAAGGSVFEYVRGVTYQKEQARDRAESGLTGILRATNIQDGTLDDNNLVYVPSELVSAKQALRLGDQVIAASSGSISVVGKAAPVSDQIVGLSFGAFCAVARPLSPEIQGWLRLFFQSPEYRQFVSETAMGNNINNLRSSDLVAIKLPLPPLPEQRRIVAKVDGLTARTARARKELNRIPTLIARHKQRLLALAFSGELTEGWRRENGLSLGNEVALGDVATDFKYGTAAKSAPSGKVPVLRMGNIQDGKLDWTNLVYTSDKAEIEKYRLTDGDVLFNRTNSPELVGKTALFKGEREAVFAGYLIRIRCGETLMPAFLSYSLNSPAGRSYCWDVKTDGVSQSNINAKKIAAFRFLLPSVEEQAEIVRRIESAFGWLDRMAADHAAAARLIPKLDAAILSKAFRGELVPQDPNDEPATVLLERIKAEREAAPAKTRGRKAKLPEIIGIGLGTTKVNFSATATVTAKPKNSGAKAMTKSRQDDDVKGKPYLAALLKSAPRSDVQSLFRAADLPVADFYKQLAWEIESEHIIDNPDVLRAA